MSINKIIAIKNEITWHCQAIQNTCKNADYFNVLSNAEQLKANQFVSELHANYYRESRAGLRYFLSHYLNQPPQSLLFKRNIFNKPYLEDNLCAFNFSDCALDKKAFWAVVVHPNSEVNIGIDIELINHFNEFNLSSAELINIIFSEDEKAQWYKTKNVSIQNALSKVWCRKEAILKAIGVGLSREMSTFSVGWLGDSVEIAIPNIKNEKTKWHVFDLLNLPENVLGAIAFKCINFFWNDQYYLISKKNKQSFFL